MESIHFEGTIMFTTLQKKGIKISLRSQRPLIELHGRIKNLGDDYGDLAWKNLWSNGEVKQIILCRDIATPPDGFLISFSIFDMLSMQHELIFLMRMAFSKDIWR
ncbi:Uncharacterized protein Fot_51295 [Forsythia ovata]|uniref:Uncharacterized protein n=1 Tax=Forsythia ovata TaxID=205694 RepID=A0ABD1PV80_9LAMI